MSTENIILVGAQKVFFRAMLVGYVGQNIPNTRVESLKKDGRNNVTVWTGGYRIVDEWVSRPDSNISAGSTTIFFNDGGNQLPVWWMQYSGFYEKEVIPFLKYALSQSYKKKTFWGGRGPMRYEKGDYLYRNSPGINGSFKFFSGSERITSVNGTKSYGQHTYSGMSLIPE